MILDHFNFTQAVRDPIWGNIRLTPELLQTTQTAAFRRLQNIRQLGPTVLVYPGATHTRAAHSFGVYNTALRLISALLEKGAESWLTRQGVASFLAAALFHDAGHFPYTHSLKELPLRDHEELTADILLAEPLKSLVAKTGADTHQAAAIVSRTLPADGETRFLRKLLSGALDPDKLDYLNRDAYYCGVPYGVQDADFIFSHVQPQKEEGIALESAAVMSVEHLLFSKYLMYRAVYWHRNVRIATAMMKKTLFAALRRGLLAPEELYSLDDTGIFALLAAKDFVEKSCAEQLKNHELFRIIAELPFDEGNAAHAALEGLERRTQAEESLAAAGGIASADLLIDIPERISFECDYKLCGQGAEKEPPLSVFTPQTVKAFTGTLRYIRVAASAKTNESACAQIAQAWQKLMG